MNYQVLARKWRPQKFSEIVGQQHIIATIKKSFLLKKVHHAYILIGTRGTGKTTIARLFAKGLNCKQGITFSICGECKNCKDIESGCFIDLIEIDAASRTKVEETREFLDNVQYMPSMGRFKVYLIDEIHMLSKHSFNALLKILEEPPIHVKFILITTEHKKIPDTILSRCLQFYLKPLSTEHIKTQLIHICKAENVEAETLVLESLAHSARGSMRDALNLLEQAIILGDNKKINSDVINNMFGVINIEHPICLIENLIDGNIKNILRQINDYSILGINWDHLLTEMLVILKEIATGQLLSHHIITTNNIDTTTNINKRICELYSRITPENVQLYYQILLLGRRELPYAPSYRTGVEIIMLRALAFKPMINTIKKQSNNKKNISFNTNKNLNANFLKNADKNKRFFHSLNNESHVKIHDDVKEHCVPVNIHNEKQNYDSGNIELNNSIFLPVEECISDTTKKLLTARLTLSQYKKDQYDKLNKIKNISDLSINSEKRTTKNILKRFSNIDTTIVNNFIHVDNTNINNTYLPKNNYTQKKNIANIHKNCRKILPNFVQKILKQAMQNDAWMCQIYRLSLPKLAKKITMNSWKEVVSTDKIYLHVRPNYYALSSNELHNIIQTSLSKDIGKTIILYIEKNDNLIMKTPMENVRILYKEKILKEKQDLLRDPYIKIIKTLFDAEYQEDDIKIL